MLVKGWCPGLHKPMEAKDGFLIRLTPPGGVLKSGQLHALAETAARYGRGIVQVTMRGNLQIRGLQAQSVATCQQILIDAALSDASPSLERIRQSVLISSLHAIDPACAPEAAEIATQLMAALERHPLPDSLPPKFCFGVDGGGFLPVGSIAADITASCEGRLWRVRCRQETRISEASKVVDAIIEFAAACAISRPGSRIATPRAVNAAPLCTDLLANFPQAGGAMALPLACSKAMTSIRLRKMWMKSDFARPRLHDAESPLHALSGDGP